MEQWSLGLSTLQAGANHALSNSIGVGSILPHGAPLGVSREAFILLPF